MAVQFDLITPVVIVGILMLMVVTMQSFMQESSAETRIITQNQAEVSIAMQILQEEIKSLTSISTVTDSTFRYVTAALDTVLFYRQGENLAIRRRSPGNPADTLFVNVGLTAIQFSVQSNGGLAPFFLRLRLDSQNSATQRDFYLRNLN
jgi:hypothetical protein